MTDDTLTAELSDGRTISVPLSWFPRLVHATPEERNNWELFASGEGIHWPDLDEHISVSILLGGWPSSECQTSFKRWQEARRLGLSPAIHEFVPVSRRETTKEPQEADGVPVGDD